MVKKIARKIYKLDATGKILGRLASTIAMILRGKNKASFVPNVDGGDFVEVSNSDKIKVTGKKLTQKTYYHTSLYLGGLKAKKLKDISMAEALKKAVWGMLPKNTLRNEMIKRLIIK
ncbi:MAG: 50S ribosomal protein L13 [Patescibacteria group bacterium]|nr:50S ribosomal protein L13 [Patescibacteria group bacterium]MDD5490497.1 50S ribosomal protein L13 [Patescibacteria group bacterium]